MRNRLLEFPSSNHRVQRSLPGIATRSCFDESALHASLFTYQSWSIGYIEEFSTESLLSGHIDEDQIVWLHPRKKSVFFADPFILDDSDGATMAVVAESYSHLSGKGSGFLSEFHFDLGSRNWRQRETTLMESDYSPLVPVSVLSRSRGIRLARTSRFRCIADLPSRAPARRATGSCRGGEYYLPIIDPTPLFRDGTWWLFGGKPAAANFELHIWHAADIAGPWTEHPLNPVEINPTGSRPAGAFFVGPHGDLLRPAQDCAGGYGRGIVFQRVDELTTTGFSETPLGSSITRVGARAPSRGIHTINFSTSGAVVDGRSDTTHPVAVVFFAIRLARRLLSRLPSRPAG